MTAAIRPRDIKTWLLIACFLFVASLTESASENTAVRDGYLIAAHDQNTAVAVATGEFRIVLANVLWSEVVDKYHHRYIAQGGDWAKNPTILPLLKSIIALDPHFVEAYEILGTILPRRGNYAESETILKEGIRYNPGHWELYRDIALLYAKKKDWSDALTNGRSGLALADDDFSKNIMRLLVETCERNLQHERAAVRSTAFKSHGLPIFLRDLTYMCGEIRAQRC